MYAWARTFIAEKNTPSAPVTANAPDCDSASSFLENTLLVISCREDPNNLWIWQWDKSYHSSDG